jgi:glycosyltransferase involved in cell wall biosynthesis
MNQPLLHVMIPAYGNGRYLELTLNSAIENLEPQTLITVIEDPSESSEIEKLAKKYNSRVSYLRNELRLGIAGNFNKCLKLSQATFTQICGHDDLIICDPSDELRKIKNINEQFCGNIFSSRVLNTGDNKLKVVDSFKRFIQPKIRPNTQIDSVEFLEKLMIGYWAYFPAILWKTDVAKQFEFNSKFESAMDLQFLVDLSIKKYEFIFSEKQILNYRRHSESASSKNALVGRRFIEEMECHKRVYYFAKEKRLTKLKIQAKIALSVRLNAAFSVLVSQENFYTKLKQLIKVAIT